MIKSLFFFLLATFSVYADYPIYFLATHPRSTGTAFENIIRTHGGIQVLHQPFLDPYLQENLPKNHPYRKVISDSTYDEVVHQIFGLAKTAPVFFKDQAFMVLDYVKSHLKGLKNPQIHFAFLIRDPAKTILSLYRKDPRFSPAEIGHEHLWELFNLIKENTGKTPLVIDSDELLKDPMANLDRLGKEWDIAFREQDLHWQEGYTDDWLRVDKKWYDEVAASDQLGSYRGELPRLEDGIPEYTEVDNLHDRARLQEIYRRQNIFYLKLLEHVVR